MIMINSHDIEMEDVSNILFDMISGVTNMRYFNALKNAHDHQDKERAIDRVFMMEVVLMWMTMVATSNKDGWRRIELPEVALTTLQLLLLDQGAILMDRSREWRRLATMAARLWRSRCQLSLCLLSLVGTSRVPLYVLVRGHYDVIADEAFGLLLFYVIRLMFTFLYDSDMFFFLIWIYLGCFSSTSLY